MVSAGNQPNVITYNPFIHAYCMLGNINEAERVMIKMNEEGISANSLTCTFLIGAYVCMGLIDGAFKHMFDAGCEPSRHTYSFLIKHLSDEKLVKANSNESGLDIISNVSSSNITDIWKTMGFEIALELFEKMIGHGCIPNMNTYGELIAGLCKERNLEVARCYMVI